MQFAIGAAKAADGRRVPTLVFNGRHFDLFDLDSKLAQTSNSASLPGDFRLMLEDWNRCFARLCAIVKHGEKGGWFSEPIAEADGSLCAPIPRPGKVLCAAANYRAHVEEMARSKFTGPAGAAVTKPEGTLRPYHFLKASSCMVGPYDDIILPSPEHRIDWEIELGAVIGKPAKNVIAERALDHVAGYVVVNDISCRAATWRSDRPNIRSDWLAGKSYDTFLPVGPNFVPAAFVDDYRQLRLRLWVDDELHQDGVAGDMIFSTEDQIAYLSSLLTLESGDLIATGTPAGVGQGKGAYLKDGDIVVAEITGLGRQQNPVRLM